MLLVASWLMTFSFVNNTAITLTVKYPHLTLSLTLASKLMTTGRALQRLHSQNVKSGNMMVIKYLSVFDKACGFIFTPGIQELLCFCRDRHGHS